MARVYVRDILGCRGRYTGEYIRKRRLQSQILGQMSLFPMIEFLVDGLGITRKTASKYLNELEKMGILQNIQIKNSKFFVNKELFDMLKKGI